MKSRLLIFLWVYAFASHLLLPALLPHFLLYTFTLPIIYSLKRIPFASLLWVGLAAGLFTDLFSSHTYFGSGGVVYVITCLIAHRLHHFLFDDKLISIAPFAWFLSAVLSLLNMITSYFASAPIAFSPTTILTEVILSPLLDMAYTSMHFILIWSLPKIANFARMARRNRKRISSLRNS